MTRTLRNVLCAGALALPVAVLAQATSSASSQDAKHDMGHHAGAGKAVVVQAQELKWGPGPAGLPPGSQAVILEGDPSKAGPFTLRAKMPANYRIAPHSHPADERVTVLSGVAKVGMGEKFDESKMSSLAAGGYFSMPKGHHHFFTTTEETVIQLNGMGPWGITYVNPADDPRGPKGQTKKAPGSAP